MNKVLLRSRIAMLFIQLPVLTNSDFLIRLSSVVSCLLKSRGLSAMPFLLVFLTSNHLISRCTQSTSSLLVVTIAQYPFFMLLFHTMSQNVIFKEMFLLSVMSSGNVPELSVKTLGKGWFGRMKTGCGQQRAWFYFTLFMHAWLLFRKKKLEVWSCLRLLPF